ncbi:hypothetical protein NLJ89_g3496 [Agrocybe chaxingu]|uniref:Uncharacterized protein n=1 Tax=Agrocybe chaxingu TaxID=84603 RepID=A0A9W8K2D4_9AGAR|nr:hypothetical protein NLJ89_g3496 [Agrocybe chaxingu]
MTNVLWPTRALLVLVYLVSVSLTPLAVAALLNRTIDDTRKDPWNSQDCPSCAITPDVSRAFNGSAIWVFFINANNAGRDVTARTIANFTMDDDPPAMYEHVPDPMKTEVDFDVLAYSRDGLNNTQHQLVISVSGDTDTYVNFDYAIYTVEDPGVPSSTELQFSSTALSTFSVPTSVPALDDNGMPQKRGIDGVSVAIGLAIAFVYLTHWFHPAATSPP